MFDSHFARRAIRVVVGVAGAGSLVAAGSMLGFLGLWTYAGFKTIAGRPAAGLMLLLTAFATLFGAGVMFAWGVTKRKPNQLIWFGFIPATAGLAFTFWLLSAN